MQLSITLILQQNGLSSIEEINQNFAKGPGWIHSNSVKNIQENSWKTTTNAFPYFPWMRYIYFLKRYKKE